MQRSFFPSTLSKADDLARSAGVGAEFVKVDSFLDGTGFTDYFWTLSVCLWTLSSTRRGIPTHGIGSVDPLVGYFLYTRSRWDQSLADFVNHFLDALSGIGVFSRN